MKFRMYGNIVELYTHEITYVDNTCNNERKHVYGCISIEHKEAMENFLTTKGIEFTTTELAQSQYEWLNKKEFNSYDEALKASEIGQEAWEKYLIDNNEYATLRAQIEAQNQAIAELTMMISAPTV